MTHRAPRAPRGPGRILLLVGLILLSACDSLNPAPAATPLPGTATLAPLAGGTSTTAPTQAAAPTPTARPALPTATPPASIPRGGTLTIRIPHDVTTLDPFFVTDAAGNTDTAAAQATGLLFSGLTRLDDALRPLPDLAASWDVAPDGLSIVFHLRPGVRWHDGQPLTVEDVIWTYTTWLALPGNTPLQYHLHDAVLQIQPATPADSTVRFWLKKPYAPILADLAAPILPKHLLGTVPLAQLATDPFSFKPVGTGPFVFATHKEGENVVLAANPTYYGGAPYLARVAFLVAPDAQVAAGALAAGQLSLAEVPAATWTDLARRPGVLNQFQFGSWADPSSYFVAFNLRPGNALADRRLRQAWALALDKAALVQAATNGTGVPIWGDIPPTSWAYPPGTPRLDNDPARARALLRDAGWTDTNGDGIVDKNGEPLQITLYVRADDPARRRAAELMGAPLAAVGISTTVAPVDFASVILAKLDPRHQPAFDWHALIMGWANATLDPDDYPLFAANQIRSAANPDGLNYVGYASPQFDALSRQARGTYDYAQRAALYAQIEALLAADLPYYPLWDDQHYLVLDRHVGGPINLTSPRYLWNVEKWWIAPGP